MSEPCDVLNYARSVLAAAAHPASRASRDDVRRYLRELRDTVQITKDEYDALCAEVAGQEQEKR